MSTSGGAGGGLPQDPVIGAAAGTVIVGTKLAGDAQDRAQLVADGRLLLDDGTVAALRRGIGGVATVNGQTGVGLHGLQAGALAVLGCIANGGQGAGAGVGIQSNSHMTIAAPSGYGLFLTGGVNIDPNHNGVDALIANVTGSSTAAILRAQRGGGDLWRIDTNGRPRAQQAAPTPSALNGSGGISIDANGHDEAGKVNVTPANALAVDTAVIRVTFANAFTNAPVVTIVAMDGVAARTQPFVTNIGTGAFDIALHVPDAVGAAMKIGFRVVGV